MLISLTVSGPSFESWISGVLTMCPRRFTILILLLEFSSHPHRWWDSTLIQDESFFLYIYS